MSPPNSFLLFITVQYKDRVEGNKTIFKKNEYRGLRNFVRKYKLGTIFRCLNRGFPIKGSITPVLLGTQMLILPLEFKFWLLFNLSTMEGLTRF